MQITEHILTHNDCWKAGRTITPKGVMVHSLGVAQPDVNVFLETWNVPGKEACVHAFVNTEGAVQTLPWNWRGWHAGTGTSGESANNTHVSFEICEPAGHTYQGGTMIGYDVKKNAAYFAAVYRNAAALTAMLCKKYSLDPMADGVVICHSEGYSRGIATNHADVMHWFPKHGKNMDLFRADVKRMMEEGAPAAGGGKHEEEDTEMEQEKFNEMFAAAMASYRAATEAKPVSAWAQESWAKATDDKVFDGTMPGGALTREQAATVLDRLGLIH